jgi:hypothetical protein
MFKRSIPLLLAVLLSALGVVASPASAEEPWWHLTSGARPSYLPPAREEGGKEVPGKGQIVVTAMNLGDATANGEAGTGGVPITIADHLPAGLTATAIEGTPGDKGVGVNGLKCSLAKLTCTDEGSLPPYGLIEVHIYVNVEEEAKTGELNEASVSGGGAQGVKVKRPITVSAASVPFGVEDYELTSEEEGGAPGTQAGSHPFQLTTSFTLNQSAGGFNSEDGLYEAIPVALAKDLNFKLPVGLIGNPHPFAQCTLAQFGHRPNPTCSPQTVLGVAEVAVNEPGILGMFKRTEPLFNLEPTVGEPARFGFLPTKETPVFLDTSIRTGEDYGVTVSVYNITQKVGFFSSTVTVWGVPGDPRHDSARGLNCLVATEEAKEAPCQPLEENAPPPFLTLPTSCTGSLHTSMEADSWLEPGVFSPRAGEPMPAQDGCDRLPFNPEVRLTPDGQAGSTPTGLTVDVHVPQEEALSAEGLAPSDVKNIVVALPEGVVLNPSASDGLQACTEEQVDLSSDTEATCPNASKIANVTIRTPLLPNPIKGYVYLASPQNFAGLPQNPFSSLVALYLVARDPVSGVLVKLPGSVSLTASGQILSTFANNPQLPFEDAELEFFGGERAPLATPAQCGPYTTTASFEPWSAESSDEAALTIPSSSTFDVTSGPNGSPCRNPLPFDPTLESGTTNINAGGFTPLTTTLSREDGQQPIQSVQLHYPAGVSGLLSGVKLCGEAQANEGTCGPESEIGETIVSVGVGSDPFTVTGGRVYITGPYRGAPFGLSIVNPAKAGPFDLQEGRPVVVRAKIEVDPYTAALTITTDPPGSPHAIPTIVEGIPLQIQHVNVVVNRSGFTFNPTNCKAQTITGAIYSSEGASSPVSDPFQVTNCGSLKFAPKFAVSTAAKTSRAGGASLHVELSYPNKAEGAFDGPEGAYTNIARVKVELPKALPSRLTTLQKACASAQFEANPAGCPPASIVGHAKAITPLLPVPLEGPAYFVSHGGEAFPSLIVVLQGDGVTVDLVGSTFINKAGITSSTFKTVPDAPVGSFELTLPQGQFSALAANGNLCKDKLAMPTEFVAQNGAEIHQTTKISVTGCPKGKHARKSSKHKPKAGSRSKKKKH